MGLLSALGNAVSGLGVNQQNLNVLSQNISNANTANYSNEIVNQQATFNNGLGSGVTVESITRTVDSFLNSEVQAQTSSNSSATAIQSYYTQIENLMGAPGSSNSIDQGINSFFSAVQNLANSPSVSAETAVVNTGVSAAAQISGLASSLQSLQLQADNQISSDITSANADLKTLQTVNNGLERASATNEQTSGLLDQRDAALADLAKYVDINPAYSANGQVSVSTTNGISLIGNSTVTQLSYNGVTSASSFSGNATLSPILVTTYDATGKALGTPATLATGGQTGSITTSLTGGEIQGLLAVRDTVIPNIAGQLDQLAASLRNQVNAVSNQGVASPPANSYTGTRLIAGDATSQYSGSIQIAALTSSGSAIASPYADEPNGMPPLTLNLATLNSGGLDSVDNIINAINQYYGPPQNKLELGNLNNVQLGMVSNTVPSTAGGGGNAVSFDFNLNNISNASANFFVSGITVTDNTGTAIGSTGSGVTSTQPSIALSSYQATAANTVTVTSLSAAGLTNGETVYLTVPTTPSTVGGVSTSSISGYFTVSNVSGNNFDITVPGVTGNGSTASAAGAVVQPPVTSVTPGSTVRTGSNGTFTVNLPSSSTATYYNVSANIATVDASGNVVTSTVSYRIPNNGINVQNNLIGATSQTGSGSIVVPTTTQAVATASLVDASGNPLAKTNGVYGNQQGYLQITAAGSTNTIAINELDSKQLGLPDAAVPQAGTNQGFSQYFGLNNFFNTNILTPTGDTVAGSALNLSVESRITANPGLISIATLSAVEQSTSPTATPNFTYNVTSGDNSISQKMASLSTSLTEFTATGGLAASATTFSQYAGEILANTSTNSTDATNTATDSQTLLTGFTSRAQAVSGVNLDQELANTVIYQNAYTASTRVITVVGQMFTELMGIIQ